MKKKVSIIIPVHNEEKDIGECLKSLREQSYKNIEMIVVDDGSTDRTKDFVKKFKRVRIIKGEHRGPGFSRNLGAKNAKGNILVFVDADMTFDKRYLKNLINPILKDKTGKIIGTTHEYEEATNLENVYSRLWGRVRVEKKDADRIVIFRAIRKDKFFELGGFDPKYGYADDQTFWIKYRIKPIVAIGTICYHKNPETLNATYKQARWIGASWKERFIIFKIPLINYVAVFVWMIIFPFAAFASSMKQNRSSDVSFLERLKFYFYKFRGYAVGVFRGVFLGKVWR